MKPTKSEIESSIVDLAAYEEWFRRGLMRLVSVRAAIISFLYAGGCLMFSTGIATAVFVGFSIYLILVAPIGRRRVERFGLLFFAIALAYWIDIVPIKKYSAALGQKIDRLLIDQHVTVVPKS